MADSLRVGTTLKVAFVATVAASLLVSLWSLTSAVGQDPHRPDIADFDVFHLVGQLIWSGHYADAYRTATMLPLETALGHRHSVFMPWSYPPAFGFVVAPLAALPWSLAYLTFSLSTLAVFCLPMQRLGRRRFWPVMLATAPAILLNIRAGQNGLLTGGLYGLAALCLLRRRPIAAGSAIGCLAFKPHLAPMLPLMLVLQKRWLTLAVAASTGLALTGLSIAVFGPAVFSAFLAATGEVRQFMAVGVYPLHRMTSIYAFLFSVGAPSALAIAVHGAVAIAILAWTARTICTTENPRVQIGMGATASAFISPYFYDYDLTTFAVGLMLLAPILSRAMTARRYGLLLFCIAVGQSLGIAVGALGVEVSLGGPVLLAVYVTVLRRVHAEARRVPAAGSQPAALSGFAGPRRAAAETGRVLPYQLCQDSKP